MLDQIMKQAEYNRRKKIERKKETKRKMSQQDLSFFQKKKKNTR